MPVRTFSAVCAFLLFALLLSACSFSDLGALFEPSPTPVPTRTRRPTATATPTETDTPTATATSTRTSTPPATATATTSATPVATATFTPAPPTATFTRRPPTLTFTPAPATNTPPPPGPACPPEYPNCVSYRWVNPGKSFDANQCTFPNGTRVEGMIRRTDGSVVKLQRRTAVMHLWIEGDNGGPYAYPGLYRDFPTEDDGRWNAEFPKRAKDYVWHIYLSPPLSDDPISADLFGTASSSDKCGEPGTKNFFVADWIVP